MKSGYQLNPSILSADFYRLGEQLQLIEKENVQWLHIDVMDGVFVPTISFGNPVIETIRKKSRLFFDVHMMTVSPDHMFESLKAAGADLITVHYEVLDDPAATLKAIRSLGLKAGISVKPATDVEVLRPYLSFLDVVLIMTVEPGFGGQKYITASREKIEKLHRILQEEGYEGKIDVEVDGGMNLETVKDALEAGANIIVAGSAVFKQDMAQNIQDFQAIFRDFENR